MLLAVIIAVLAIVAVVLAVRWAHGRRRLPELTDEESSPVPLLIPLSREPMERERMPEMRTTLRPRSAMPASPPPPASSRLPELPPAAPRPMAREPEGTLQLLPGRLEVVSGDDGKREIRFVRGGPVTEITIGRAEGPPHLHVQFGSRTVSRLHARLRFEDGQWSILNLSPTNPVVVNGRQLNGEGLPLRDGDQVELGEVVLRFHPR